MGKEIICAGFGGQGVLTAGMLLINAGMEQDKNVLFYPSYGSEMRGGTANCTVKVSEKLIASPISKHPDILFTMNTPAIDKFEERLKPGGLLLVNSSIVPEDRKYRDDIKIIKIPATDIAAEVRNPKGANLVIDSLFHTVLVNVLKHFDPEIFCSLVTELDHLFKFPGCIYMKKREWRFLRVKSFHRKMKHYRTVFSYRIKHYRLFALCCNFTDDVNCLRFQLIQM